MNTLSMSQFVSKEDFLQAKADLEKQEKELVRVLAEPGNLEVTRLICGIEMKMSQFGKHWNLKVKKHV